MIGEMAKPEFRVWVTVGDPTPREHQDPIQYYGFQEPPDRLPEGDRCPISILDDDDLEDEEEDDEFEDDDEEDEESDEEEIEEEDY